MADDWNIEQERSDADVDIARTEPGAMDEAIAAKGSLIGGEATVRARLSWRIAILVAAVVALLLIWTLTPLREWVSPAEVTQFVRGMRSSPFAPILIMGVFVAATLLMVPVNVLILGTGLAFGPLLGVLYSMAGVLAAASAGYGTGRVLGRETLQRFSSSRINKLSRRLAKSGVLAVAAARIVPVAPFGIVNLVAGASYIRYWQFLAGTLIGNLPGILLMTLFGPSALRALIAGQPSRWVVVAGILVVVAVVGGALTWIRRGRERSSRPSYPELRPSNARAD